MESYSWAVYRPTFMIVIMAQKQWFIGDYPMWGQRVWPVKRQMFPKGKPT